MKKIIVNLLILLATASVVKAQRTWFDFEISKSLNKKLEIALAPEIRFT